MLYYHFNLIFFIIIINHSYYIAKVLLKSVSVTYLYKVFLSSISLHTTDIFTIIFCYFKSTYKLSNFSIDISGVSSYFDFLVFITGSFNLFI